MDIDRDLGLSGFERVFGNCQSGYLLLKYFKISFRYPQLYILDLVKKFFVPFSFFRVSVHGIYLSLDLRDNVLDPLEIALGRCKLIGGLMLSDFIFHYTGDFFDKEPAVYRF